MKKIVLYQQVKWAFLKSDLLFENIFLASKVALIISAFIVWQLSLTKNKIH
jgi:hypothetical protein